jgi:hypothetical protein
MREVLKKHIENIMVTGTDPALVYKTFDGVPGISSIELYEVIREVTNWLEEEDIIHDEGERLIELDNEVKK